MPFDPTPEGNFKCLGCGNVYEPAAVGVHECKGPQDAAGPSTEPSTALAAERAATEDPEDPEDGAARQPLTITLAGQTFRIVEQLSLGAQFDLAEAWESNGATVAALTKLIRAMIASEDEKRFEQWLYSKDVKVDPEELKAALVDGVRKIGGRPFPQ